MVLTPRHGVPPVASPGCRTKLDRGPRRHGKDEQGGVLPGASVRVTSPALIGGPSTMPTNEKGQLRFPVLPPGTYAVDIELQGFAPYHEEDIRIGAGTTLERTVVLKLEGIAESIVVEGSGSRIEARGSGFETRVGPEYLRAIPARRFSMFDSIGPRPVCRRLRRQAAPSTPCPHSARAATRTCFSSTARTSPARAPACRARSRASTSSRKCRSSRWACRPSTATSRARVQRRDQTRRRSFSVRRVLLRADGGLTSQPVLRPVTGRPSPSGYER